MYNLKNTFTVEICKKTYTENWHVHTLSFSSSEQPYFNSYSYFTDKETKIQRINLSKFTWGKIPGLFLYISFIHTHGCILYGQVCNELTFCTPADFVLQIP